MVRVGTMTSTILLTKKVDFSIIQTWIIMQKNMYGRKILFYFRLYAL